LSFRPRFPPYFSVFYLWYLRVLASDFSTAVGSLGVGYVQSLVKILKFRPSLVVGTGGYVSAPVACAAHTLKIPLVLLEQNTIPGKTTKFLSKVARNVCVSFEETTRYLPASKVVVTGNPVREEILSTSREEGRARLGIPPGWPCILVTGASQGARSINEALISTVERFRDREWVIIHITGEKNYQEVKARGEAALSGGALQYQVKGFISNIADAYAACDLAICRAGATTIAELTARGIPSIIIPYPYSAEGHQEKNARWLELKGASVVIKDADAARKLPELAGALMDEPARLGDMAAHAAALGKPHAISDILKVLEKYLSNERV